MPQPQHQRIILSGDDLEKLSATLSGGSPRVVTAVAAEQMAAGLVVIDAAGTILSSNGAARAILGLSAKDFHGRTSRDPQWNTIREDGSPFPVEEHPSLRSLRTGETCRNVAAGIRRSDGTYCWILINSVPLFRNEEGPPVAVVVTFLDITERFALRSQLHQAQKLDAIGKLAAGIAHDVRNLLTVITLRIGLMRKSSPAEAVVSGLDAIADAVKRGTALTQQLLAVGRKQALEPRELDIRSSLGETAELLRSTLGKQIQLKMDAGESTWSVFADPGAIDQVVTNLVLNARDAMPAGGTILLEAKNRSLDLAAGKQLGGLAPGEYVTFSVSDTGGGIPLSARERIFEPFFSTKPASANSGLGLSIVYGIVQQHRGHIWVYSELDRGTTFKVFLPRFHPESQPPAEPIPLQGLRSGTGRILLAEDDDAIASAIEELLADAGHAVIRAKSTAEAVDLCQKDGFDLLIADVLLGGDDERDLPTLAVGLCPGLRVILISGFSDSFLRSVSAIQPGFRFLEKPIAAEDLLRAVRELLE